MKLGITSNNGIYSNNYSLDFNGSTQSITVDTLAGDINGALGTISCWCKLDTVSTSAHILRAKVDSNNILVLFYHASSNEFRALHKGGGTTKSAVIASGDTIENDGNFHNIVMTWSEAADELKIYLDGTLKATTGSLGTFSGTLTEADIAQNLSNGAYWNGKISEVAVFTQVVSATTLYNSGNPSDLTGITGLVGYYKFEEGSGTSAIDSSGLANTGTLVNAPTYTTDTP
tara:strand:- start:1236 stop:1925 length:690 start_codon:yes stop_codon:yes gene_type:complete